MRFRCLALCLLLAAALPATALPAAAQQLRALVIGADDYRFERKLRGGVSDADALAAALRPIDPALTLLRDAQVTRASVLAAWRATLARAAAGDTLLVTFSGHGGREWMGVSQRHPRGFREFWVLPLFDRATEAGQAERILPDDIAGLVAEAHAAQVGTVLLADHCYSGAVFRSLGVDAHSVRQVPPFAAPGAPPMPAHPPRVSETATSPPPPGLTSLGASRADWPVSEFRIGDAVHGALSAVLARALTDGRADIDPDGSGLVRRGVFLRFLARGVDLVTGGAQEPQLRPPLPEDEVLFRLAPPALAAPAIEAGIAVHVAGDQAAGRLLVAGIAQAVWEDDPAKARLIWQPRDGDPRIVNGLGLFVSFRAPLARLADAVGSAAASDALLRRAGAGRMTLEQAAKSGLPRSIYFQGDRLELTARGLPGPNLVAFNLAWDGEVQVLYPDERDAPIAWPSSGVVLPELSAAGPFGEDHAFAVASPHPLAGLRDRLLALEGAPAMAGAARGLVEQALADDPQAQLAATAIYTVPLAHRCDPEVTRTPAMAAECGGP